MDPSTTDWIAAENKAFKNALAEVDLNSSNWFEHLIARFPDKTPEQLRDHYLDLIVDIERMESEQFANPVHTNPWTVEATETEDLLVMDLPYSPGFSGSMCSGPRSMPVPRKKLEEEDLLLPVDKGAKEAMLSEETMRASSFLTIAEGLMEESTNEVVKQEALVPKIQGREILSPEITEGKNEVLSQKTNGIKMLEDLLMETEMKMVLPEAVSEADGIKMLEDLLVETEMEMVLPEAVSEVQRGKRVLGEVTGVAEGNMLAADLGTPALTKGKQWTEEEHRLFLVGLNIHGKGAWRSIAKNFVRTRTSTQVASHAQKYFHRQLEKRQRRRCGSVLDITTIPETIEPYQGIMCDSVNTNSQTQLNNANQYSPSIHASARDGLQPIGSQLPLSNKEH